MPHLMESVFGQQTTDDNVESQWFALGFRGLEVTSSAG